ARMFGNPARASAVLSAWGLRWGEDVGAIIGACVDAGWLVPASGASADDFRGINLPFTESGGGRRSNREPSVRERPSRRPATAGAKVRRGLLTFLLRFCGTACVGLTVIVAYVLWAERLTAEERPLVGRWYAFGDNGDERLGIFDFGPDRS